LKEEQVYVLIKKSETVNKQPGDLKQFTESITQRNAGMFGQAWMKSFRTMLILKITESKSGIK
jgi:superoxide dismutase